MGDFRPQRGPQELFLSLDVDFAIYGGAAGGGKSYGLVLEAARFADDPAYTGIMFRRTSVELKLPGSIVTTARMVYGPSMHADVTEDGTCHWPAGGILKFSHLQYEKNLTDHHSAQYLFIGFDEIQTFPKKMVIYMLSRNRPGPGCTKKAYMRAACNPDADSWLRGFLDWWIDPETGYAIRERSGLIRYFWVNQADEFEWVDKDWVGPNGERPLSFTFVAADLEDNQVLMETQPEYKQKLMAQDRVTRERLLKGNWNITNKGGMFDPDWFKIEPPSRLPDGIRLYRYWDMAATEKKGNKDPDYTAGVLGGLHGGELWIVDAVMWQQNPGYTERMIKKTAASDGRDVAISIEEEKGSAGKHVMSHYQRNVLSGFEFHADPVTGQKSDRAAPWCALAEQGHVHLVQGKWNGTFKAQAASFPVGKRDMIDAASGCYKMATGSSRVWPAYSSKMFKELSLYAGPEEWKKLDPREVLVYCTLVADKQGTVYGNYYVWSRKSEKLWVFSDFSIENPTGTLVRGYLKEAIDIPVNEADVQFMAVRRIIGSDEMFQGASEDMAHQLRKERVRVHQCHQYDLMGMAMRAHSMMVNGQIIVGNRCNDSDEQYRSWTSKGRVPDGGYPHCVGLCMIVGELKSMGELSQQRQMEPYSDMKMRVRDHVRNLGKGSASLAKRTGDEWML